MESVTRKIFVAVAVLAVAACSAAGTANRNAAPSEMLPAVKTAGLASSHRHRGRVHAYAHIIIPRRYSRRHGNFVSSATRGIQIVAKSGKFTQTTVAALGPGAPGCNSFSSGFACVVTATVWEGTNTIDVTTYDKAPASSAFPAGAKVLGIASVTEDVTPASNSLTIFLGGKIGSINGSPAFSTVAADGISHDVAIVVNPKDFGGQPITAGSSDPYANPINVTLTEGGGSGHAQLVIGGTATGSSGKIKFTGDTLAVRYDGGGTAGYTMSVQLAAKGAPTETLAVSPLVVEGNGVYQHALALNGTSSTPTLTITEASPPPSQTYTVTASGCSGVATTPGSVTGSGGSATFSVNGGTSPSATGCSLSIADVLYGTTLVLPVTNTPFSGGISVGGVNIQEYALPATPGPITLGPDGNLWFVVGGSGGSQLTAYRPSATGPALAVSPFNVGAFSSLYGIDSGPDGNLWVSDQSNLGLDRVTTAGAVTVYSGIITDCPVGIANASDGTMWAVNSCGSPYYYNVTTGGSTTNFSPAGASNPTQIVVGKDGAFYAADGTNIDRWDGTTLTQVPEPNGVGIASLTSVPSDGATGAIWYTSNVVSTTTTGYVGRWALGAGAAANVASYNNTNNGGQLNGIAAAPDGTVWFADSLDGRLGRCKIASQTCVEFPSTGTLPHTSPQDLVVGPDGSLWFTDLSGYLGHVIP